MAHSSRVSQCLTGAEEGLGPSRPGEAQGLEPSKVQYLDSFCVLLIKGANVKSVSCIHLPTWGDQWRRVLHRAEVGHQHG